MFLKRVGIKHQTLEPTRTNKKEWKKLLQHLEATPIMVAMSSDDDERWIGGHWIVIYDQNNDYIKFLDPQFPLSDPKHDSKIDIKNFVDCWTGYSIRISNSDKINAFG